MRDHENILVSADQCPHRLYILNWELARTDLSGLEIGLFSNYWDKEVRLPENHAPKLLDAYSHTLSKDVRLAQDTSVHWGINFVFWMSRDILVTRSWYKTGLERAWDSLYTSEILIS